MNEEKLGNKKEEKFSDSCCTGSIVNIGHDHSVERAMHERSIGKKLEASRRFKEKGNLEVSKLNLNFDFTL